MSQRSTTSTKSDRVLRSQSQTLSKASGSQNSTGTSEAATPVYQPKGKTWRRATAEEIAVGKALAAMSRGPADDVLGDDSDEETVCPGAPVLRRSKKCRLVEDYVETNGGFVHPEVATEVVKNCFQAMVREERERDLKRKRQEVLPIAEDEQFMLLTGMDAAVWTVMNGNMKNKMRKVMKQVLRPVVKAVDLTK
nr:MAG: hypothetical protein [Cressdnaviricota sp.]